MRFEKTKVCKAALAAIGGAIALTSLPTMVQAQERVEVTGSRIKRVDAEGALPVETLTREDIQRGGFQSTEALLASLSAVNAIGGTQLSTGAGASTYGVSTISMRGLGDDRTLVLVNGRRLAPQAGAGGTAVNVNMIPLAAIERVEVLKDGASSVYGSDAVAGVVNFILRKDLTGLDLSASLGTPTRDGGGENGRIALAGGFGDLAKDRFNVSASVSYEKDKALFGRDRSFARNGTVLPYFVSGATGQGNIEGAYTTWEQPGVPYDPATEPARRQPGFGNSPGTGYGNPLAAQNKCESISMRLNPTPTSKGAPYCNYDPAPDVGLVPDRELLNLSANFTFQLADDHQLFADALWGRSTVTQAIQPSPVRRSFNTTNSNFAELGIDPALLIRPQNPHYGIAADYLNAQGFGDIVGQPLAFTARVFDFGPRTSEDESTQTRIVLGGRGVLPNNMDYEVAYAYNESQLKGKVIDGYFTTHLFNQVVNQPDSDYNPWSLQQSETFKQRLAASGAEYAGPTLDAKGSSHQVDGLLRGDAFSLGGGMSQYAAGALFRREAYRNSPSPALESGAISGLGGSVPPVDEDRDAWAVFGEMNFPVMKNLELGAGLRYDNYSDAGGATTYKATAGWRPISSVLVRGNVGTGFRAPTMEELYQPQTLGTSEQFDDPLTGQTDLQVNSLTGGNPDLKPEKSTQWSIGGVWQATQAFSIGADYWSVKIKDAITTPSAQLVVSRYRAGDPSYQDKVTLSPEGDIDSIIQTLSNTGQLDVTGIDVTAQYSDRIGPGRLGIGFVGTYISKFDETTPSGTKSKKVATIVEPNGDPVIGADEGGVVLRWKHVLSFNWTQGAWSTTLVQNFYDRYEMGNDLNGERRYVPSRQIWDLNVQWSGLPNTTLGLGVRNLFDTDPPIFIPVSNQFQSGYDAALEDPRRRFIYVTANYRF